MTMRSFGAGGGLTPNTVTGIRFLNYVNNSSVRPGVATLSGSHDSLISYSKGGDGKKDVLTTTSSPSSPVAPNNEQHVWASYIGYSGDGSDVGGDWEYVNGFIDDTHFSLFDGHVFGAVPSTEEVRDAVSSLQRVLSQSTCDGDDEKDESSVCDGVKDDESSVCGFVKDESDVCDGVKDDESVWGGVKNESVVGELEEAEEIISRSDSSSGTTIDSWVEPSLNLYNSNSKMMQLRVYDGVYDALYMLKHNTAVQKMVKSLSNDNAVWDAVLNNEVVREIRESISQAASGNSAAESSKASSSESVNFFSSFIANVKEKIKGLIDALRMAVNRLNFHQEVIRENVTGGVNEAEEAVVKQVKVSFTLAMIVFLIVVLRRIESA